MKAFSTILLEIETKKRIKELFPDIAYGEGIKKMLDKFTEVGESEAP